MFDIGSPEVLLIAIVALLVIGPERLPEAIRALATWWGRLKRWLALVSKQISDEIGFDRIRQQLDEEGMVEEIKALKIELNQVTGDLGTGLSELTGSGSDPANPSHWPGMPPSESVDEKTGPVQ